MEARIHPGESVSDVVVRVVSEIEDCPPEELPPLYDTVDPDALDALCAHQPTGGCTISFDFSDSHVVVDRCETVTATRHSE